jgi:hypothetical protein
MGVREGSAVRILLIEDDPETAEYVVLASSTVFILARACTSPRSVPVHSWTARCRCLGLGRYGQQQGYGDNPHTGPAAHSPSRIDQAMPYLGTC